MNAVEIEEAISQLAGEAFDPAEFPYSFLLAFGEKEITIKRLRSGNTNKSDLDGVLQVNNIHIKVCEEGQVTQTLSALKESPATTHAKAKFVVATDGKAFQAENINSGEVIVCDYPDFQNHFGFFLALAGISTVKEIRESAFDIKATGRLNKLYVELLRDNPDWGTEARRPEMNHFMARLIFCFFAEDTEIFNGENSFTSTIGIYSKKNGSDTHEIISRVFRSMNTKPEDRKTAKIANWANGFPYVNGGLFSGSTAAPKFSRIAKSYLMHIGKLDWTKINPDIFGSMIQAVADDEERGSLGMHYTSVPNILKVLNPLFLDDLREQLQGAGDNKKKLKALRERISKIRVFDPACGSGNFLVIAYKEMRAIEAQLNQFSGDPDRRTDIPLTNFRGIELKGFSAEIARLALIIAEYQCDVTYRGQKEALAGFLPLDNQNWITQGNALRIDWLSVCPPTSKNVKLKADDLFMSPLEQAQMDFENEGGETYICGNPPYKGSAKKTVSQKEDLKFLFDGIYKKWGIFDYVCGWFYKAQQYSLDCDADFAFVATNSVAQGQQVCNFWKPMFDDGMRIKFAVRSFKWKNLAANDAGVSVVCICGSQEAGNSHIYENQNSKLVKNINAYLIEEENLWIKDCSVSYSGLAKMQKGNYYALSQHLEIEFESINNYIDAGLAPNKIKKFFGADEIIKNKPRHCLWFIEYPTKIELSILDIGARLSIGISNRSRSKDAISNGMFDRPHQFREMRHSDKYTIALPVVSSENRKHLPVGVFENDSVFSNAAFAIYDAPLWNMALIASRIHLVWIATVCGKLETRYRYSNTLGWNTFPVPKLTEKNKADLTRCAENILLAREAHFPATIADLYKPDAMPENLRAAHERNDEVLERIYIGRRFRNDTERLEKLFELYTKMTTEVA